MNSKSGGTKELQALYSVVVEGEAFEAAHRRDKEGEIYSDGEPARW